MTKTTDSTLFEADSELRDAIKKYLKAGATADGRPTYEYMNIDTFVGVATMKLDGKTVYMAFANDGQEYHETLGLIETLRHREINRGL